MKTSGISVGGAWRLRRAIEAEVLRECALELQNAKGFWAKQAIKRKIREEAKKRMGQVTSPGALYCAVRWSDIFRR